MRALLLLLLVVGALVLAGAQDDQEILLQKRFAEDGKTVLKRRYIYSLLELTVAVIHMIQPIMNTFFFRCGGGGNGGGGNGGGGNGGGGNGGGNGGGAGAAFISNFRPVWEGVF